MTDEEFEHLGTHTWEHLMGELNIVLKFSGSTITAYFRDSAKLFTEEQMAIVAGRICSGLRVTMNRPVVIDLTSKPPY